MKDRIQDLINKMTDEEKASMLIRLVCLVLTGQYNLPKEKKHKVPGQRVDYRHTRLEFHLQLLLAGGPDFASNLLEEAWHLLCYRISCRYSAFDLEYHFDQYRGKSNGNEVKRYGVDVFGTRGIFINRCVW
jgi:hypothetical protein